MSTYELMIGPGTVPIKMWTEGVSVEQEARNQLVNIATMPFIHKHVAVMPDVHLGKGATVGSVVPTKGAVMAAQADLVDVVHTLRQVLCVKG